jgi:hypothetical protein
MNIVPAAMALAITVLAALPAAGKGAATPAERLVGTWKLVSMVREEQPSGIKTDLMGPHPLGYIAYGRDGRMMVLIVRSDRKKPAGANATAAEASALFDSMVSYAGRYTIAGNRITHHVDTSWNESWTGTEQLRFFKIDGDRLTVSGAPSPDPVEHKMSVLTLTWERVR